MWSYNGSFIYISNRRKSNKDFYDSYNTLLAPYASKTIRSKLGPDHQYSLTDAKIIKIERSQKYTFTFIVVAKYRTYTNAHNPPNHVVTITYNVSPSGVKVIDFKQKKKENEFSAEDVYQGGKPAERKCPTCKHDLVIRNSNKTGNKFFGCSQYPTCTHTEPINS